MPLGYLLGLGAAGCWGAADFLGGLMARRLPTLTVILWSHATGGLALTLGLLALGQAPPPSGIAWGVAAGLFSGAALILLYRGLALGAMSIVAPISACGAVVPLIVSLVGGESPALLAWLGVLAAFAGVVLVSIPSRHNPHPSGRTGLVVLLALGAAAGFGVFFVLVDQGSASGGSPFWTAVGSRIGSLSLVVGLLAVSRQAPKWPGRRLPVVASIGLGDTSATALFGAGSMLGNLGEVAVLASLYPVGTVLLARTFLAERLSPLQGGGVILALIGVVLISTG